MRDRFLLDPDVVFLNHGAYGACPREVFAVYQRWQLELERNPVDFLGRRSAALLAEARAALAACVGASPAHMVFVPNATTGINVVARFSARSAPISTSATATNGSARRRARRSCMHAPSTTNGWTRA